jgi:hypothetical protein
MIRLDAIRSAVVTLLIVGSLKLNAQVPSLNQSRLPRFEDYPVTDTFNGPAAPVRLTRWEERMFRTRLTEASKEPPDFAGHYRFAG